jgi:TRAP-type C4-dicarboxylate transport system permease small subunit
MEGFLNVVNMLSKFLNRISGIALIFIMVLTAIDVILRIFWMPIKGTYEIVGLTGAVVIGFGIPLTSWMRGNISVEFLIEKLPKKQREIVNLLTRVLGIALFVVIGWNLLVMGFDLYEAGEVTLTRQLPYYPVAYGLGICCFVQSLVLICDILRIVRGEYE